jgi:uracil-DNA glycosylase family 4
MPVSNWYADPFRHFIQMDDAMKLANVIGTDYNMVRTVQQAYTTHMPAVKHHIKQYKDCEQCSLGKCIFMKNRVFYRGYVPCDVLFVGEAPGKNEDTQARPFIGEEGRLLDDIITDVSLRLTSQEEQPRDNAFRWCITTTVMCVPYDKGEIRTPTSAEVAACSNRLLNFIHICTPAVIVSIGTAAEKAMKVMKITNLRFAPHYPVDPDLRIPRQPAFTPLHFNIPTPKWMLKQKDTEQCKKSAVLSVYGFIKPLWDQE